MSRSSSLLKLVLCLALVPSCADGESGALPPESPLVGPAMVDVRVGPTTTDGLIAQQNLTAQIEGLRAAAERGFAGPEVIDALVDALLTRAQFFGTWGDFDEALALSAERLEGDDTVSAAYQRRASALAAVHRFPEALEVLNAAPPNPGIAAAILTITEARGGSPNAVLAARQRSVTPERPMLGELVSLARALAAVGRFEDADAVYVEAAAGYADVSPFPIAWIAFSRGVMWGEVAGRPDLARPLYLEAVARVPGYVVANVHLAELEADADDPSAAVDRLARLPLAAVVDPEPDAVLGRISSDAEFTKQALAGYERMLGLHPEAVWDHATEFFLADGNDPARALELAMHNLALRQTERAYLLAMRAALANDDRGEAQRLAALVDRPIHTASLRELVRDITGS